MATYEVVWGSSGDPESEGVYSGGRQVVSAGQVRRLTGLNMVQLAQHYGDQEKLRRLVARARHAAEAANRADRRR